MLQEMLISRATVNPRESDSTFQFLRFEFVNDPVCGQLLPQFVRTCRTLSAFWGWISAQSGQWEPRRRIIREAFVPLLDHLERGGTVPVDEGASAIFSSFDSESVHAAWEKALRRRTDDPEGAITAARTLLETVCKRILDDQGVEYGSSDDLPKLYGNAAKQLNLAPSQHTEEVFRTVLGGCHTVVNGLSTIRNRIGDAHGHGGGQVRPMPRHAALAVNLAGALATFLIETLNHRKQQSVLSEGEKGRGNAGS
jgi:hypothetical protein